ncbi:hypothetical protein MIND_00100100 [Mycena indigotica]|uniref:F-box domain-containing protein n=1 Tax=Mycena indigotica TaxID=2126181 RepID=A0A8H6TFN3_9AGAR|nr:uncharacterized protein MIND_00100100 [Mycena indigotica]KAF7315837.1 hypothetical protein MIND_00100100 [Mycena indigotica]
MAASDDYLNELLQLRRENVELREAVGQLSGKLLAAYEALSSYRRPKISVAELPHEILLAIFPKSLPPLWMLRNTRELTLGSMYTIDLEYKTSLTLVCKNWNLVATEMLYKNIHLRSVGQMTAFLRTLSERKSTYGEIVRRIDLSCFVPRGYHRLFDEQTRQILANCPRLNHFGFVPIYRIPSLCHNLPTLPTTITSIEFTEKVDTMLMLGALTQLCGSLRSVCLPFSEGHQDWYPQLNFLLLEELRVSIRLKEAHITLPMPLIWTWSMPKLERLWLTSVAGGHQSIALIPLFLEAFGTNVTFLALNWNFGTSGILEDIFCPKLKHLAVTCKHWIGECTLTVRGHPGLQFLDVWCFRNKSRSRQLFRTELPPLHIPDISLLDLRSQFPCIEVFRCLDIAFQGVYSDIPFVFPPGRPNTRGEVDVHRLLQTRHQSLSIQFAQMDTLPLPPWMATILEFMPHASIYDQHDLRASVDFEELGLQSQHLVSAADDSDDDSEWLPKEDDSSEEDSDYSIEEDIDKTCLEGECEFYPEEEWQIGTDEALGIFDSIISASEFASHHE